MLECIITETKDIEPVVYEWGAVKWGSSDGALRAALYKYERFSLIVLFSVQPLAAMSVFNSPAFGFSP
jgi:hypothetical protein